MTDADDLPDGWAVATIEDLCTLNPKHPATVGDATEVSFVPMAAVSELDGRIVGTETRKYGEVKKGYTHFADGDVIFAKITPCMENGKAASVRGLVNGFACGTTEFFVFRSRGAVDQDYLFHFIRQESYRKAARATMQSGVGQARVPKEFVLSTELPLPPLAEQRRIVAKVEELTARTKKVRELLFGITGQSVLEAQSDLALLEQSILAKAFRGELVPQDPADEPAAALLARIKAGVDEATLGLLGFAVAGTTHPSQWSRTKSQKFGYLAVTHLGYPAGLEFGPGKAGPYADELRRAEEFAAQRGYFTVSTEPKDDPGLSAATRFTPGPHRQAGHDLGRRHFGTRADEGQRLLEQVVAMTTPEAELFGTAYAVWGNLLAAGGTADDAAIVAGVHAWHEEKAKKFPADMISERLAWMRETGYTPTGGKPTTPVAKPKPPRKRKG